MHEDLTSLMSSPSFGLEKSIGGNFANGLNIPISVKVQRRQTKQTIVPLLNSEKLCKDSQNPLSAMSNV